MSDKPIQSDITLRSTVELVVNRYFATLDGANEDNLYQIVLKEVEIGLIKTTLKQTKGNKTHAASILGLARGTLISKCKVYNLD